jgi:hypothetical protein
VLIAVERLRADQDAGPPQEGVVGTKLRLERRNGGSGIHARTYMQGKLVLKSTGETTLHAATKIATDWYLDLRDRTRRGEHRHGFLPRGRSSITSNG